MVNEEDKFVKIEDTGEGEQLNEVDDDGTSVESADDDSAGDDEDCPGDDESSDEYNEKEGDELTDSGNAAWADAMRKVLGTKPVPTKRSLVLSKAKTLIDYRKKLKGENGEEEDKAAVRATIAAQAKKKRISLMGREKPDVLQKDKEKMLSKVANRGVVQLFNVVNKHRKMSETGDAASANTKKKEVPAVNKKAFLSLLTGVNPQTDSPESENETEMKEEKENPHWEVLRDNFMTQAKLKNWDKSVEPDNLVI